MKKMIMTWVAGLLLLGVSAQKTVINDPNAELRLVTKYHGIEVSSAIELYLSPGDQEVVAVSAKDVKWRDRIHTEVTDGILKISLDAKGWAIGNNKLKAYVSFIQLDKLDASGASNVYVDGVIGADKLSITLSGASDFKGAVKVADLELNQRGASDALITGIVTGMATIVSSGASDVKGYDLETQTCNARATGASDIHVTVRKELSASASGASSIYYKGEGVIKDQHASGASSVSKKS